MFRSKRALLALVSWACVAVSLLLCRPSVQARQPEQTLLPKNAVWVYTADRTLDGKLGDDAAGGPYQVTVINNRITTRPTAPDYANRVVITGESVPGIEGKAPAVFFRQDNEDIKGEVSFHCGQLVGEGRIVGTWHNNRGQSGDF